MSSRTRRPARRPVLVSHCLMLLAVGIGVLGAASAKAANYNMVLCAANSSAGGFSTATNTASAVNPQGIFVFQNSCGAAPYPAGNHAFLRILESQASGNAGVGAFGSMSWTPPHAVAIVAGGGYTRQPDAFNDGWRARFWAEGYDGSANNILMQGSGVANGSLGGIGWAPTPTFGSHLWPFGGYGNYRRFVFEMTCVRQAGCDRAGFNATDANTLVLTLNDVDPSRIALTNTASGFLAGAWARGTQSVSWDVADQGSGLRFERMRVDRGERLALDWRPTCDLGANAAIGEFARDFRPCPVGSTSRNLPFDTGSLADGGHTLQVCSQDYGQAAAGGESCDQRTIRTDNTAPGPVADLQVTSANPARYLDRFGARWTLSPDPGSPIVKVHYSVLDAADKVVVGEKVFSAANPSELTDITGPARAGEYHLRVWLEDEVGLIGPATTAPIPHDTTPPPAPQALSVTSPATPRSADGFDLRWQNIVDAGARIDAAHYEVLDGDGKVVGQRATVAGDNIQAIGDLDAPGPAGSYQLRLWLSDAEGNVGAPITAPLSYDCQRSLVRGATLMSTALNGKVDQTLQQGQDTTLIGSLRSPSGAIATSPVCVFSRVETDSGRDFLGIALTDAGGGYRFPIPAGPSREVIAIHRDASRQLSASAQLHTVVHPTLRARKTTVYNGESAFFEGEIPGPHNDSVTIVLQVKNGKGWLAFRRYRTRNDGHFEMTYPFVRTTRPTSYEMRAQVRKAVGYPYVEGDSDPVVLRVLPESAKPKKPAAKNRCAKRKRVGRRASKRCPKKHRGRHRASARH
jgi:hypothetical protein